MCVQRKKPEVSIMYLRGDTSILVPAVFSEIVAILTAPAVIIIFGPKYRLLLDLQEILGKIGWRCEK
jgi:hypothetical protein